MAMEGTHDAQATAPRPWGRTAGILIACYVTLVGLVAGLDPEVILLRAVIASVATALVVRTVVDLVPLLRDANR